MKKIKILLLVFSILMTTPVIFAKSSDKDNNPKQNENKELLSWNNLGTVTVSLNGEGKISYTGDLYMAKMGTLLLYQFRIGEGKQAKNYVVQRLESKQPFNAVIYINGPNPFYLNVPAWAVRNEV